MNMQNDAAQHESVKPKMTKKIKKPANESEELQQNSLQTFMADKKILQPLPREEFFPWLTEEVKKLKAEDDSRRGILINRGNKSSRK